MRQNGFKASIYLLFCLLKVRCSGRIVYAQHFILLPDDCLTQLIKILLFYMKSFAEPIGTNLIVAFTKLPEFEQPLVDIRFTAETTAARSVQHISIFVPYIFKGTFQKIRRQMVIMKARKPFPRNQQKGFQPFSSAVFVSKPLSEIPLHDGTLFSFVLCVDDLHI